MKCFYIIQVILGVQDCPERGDLWVYLVCQAQVGLLELKVTKDSFSFQSFSKDRVFDIEIHVGLS